MYKKFTHFFFFVLFFLAASTQTFAQRSGGLTGKITDAQSGEELPGATVRVKGTTVGAVTDIYGEYLLTVPAGKHTLEFSFLGYASKELEVDVEVGTIAELNIQLSTDAQQLDEIVVTGQALGQMAAINQQINSNTIVNVVSKDKIESIPDQNAAESVGRLPGIAIQRDGGEGQKVVVRGLSPRFNAITINGERIPSTDPQDRSVDLSFIAPEQLEGIEVYKALTPDKDADAVGGTINFIAKKADSGWSGRIRASAGYNSLAEEYGQPRINASVSNRFLDDKLGVLLTGNFQRANRSSDVLTAGYESFGNAQEIRLIGGEASDIDEIRKRFGGSMGLDYKLGKAGSLTLNTTWGETQRDETRFRHSHSLDGNQERFQIREREQQIRAISNTLAGEHNVFGGWIVNWKTSYSFTRQETPLQQEMRFRVNGAYPAEQLSVTGRGPTQLFNDLSSESLENVSEAALQRGDVRGFEQLTKEDIYTASMDFSKDFNLGSKITGKLKFGGKARFFDRSNDAQNFRDNGNGPNDGLSDLVDEFPDEFETDASGNILFEQFISSNSSDDFLDGDLDFGPSVDINKSRRFFDVFGNVVLNRRDILDASIGNADYEATELISAGYVMSEFKVKKLTLLGGVRVERTDAKYTGFETLSQDDDNTEEGEELDVIVRERVNEVYYVDVLPMVHLRYNFTNWFDVRAAVTKSLSRPNFQNWVPWQNIDNANRVVRRGNPNLRNAIAWNYDLFFSFYNELGLFTVGLFHKEIDNIDVLSTRRNITGLEFRGFTIEEPIFLSETSTVQGIEIDFQTNLRQLPSPFDGIVFSANATFIKSETFYPVFDLGDETRQPDLFNPNPILTFREGSIPGQPDLTANLSLGYEKGGFSGRVSVLVQEDSFDELGSQELFDSFTGLLTRWDASVKQNVTDQLQVFANWNNITNSPPTSFQASGSNETFRELFGATVDLGVSYKFFK
ncbi:TonB-dependent receptor [Fulvivirga sp. M361]|uniref:TonB-dependent receptor n=1 Tax=Fulvivirga sp. M361 TaxID=2594266 RepID=UPI001179BBE1|nr:TonB-dependent receptor [Fulvivirga sp. M361]TRX48578.1 TonB-dependent receptor [Fulvivirga sp. M361]